MYSRGRYGEIIYAKSWCGFKNPRAQKGLYETWRNQIKAYIQAQSLDPGRLTEAQFDSVLVFASALSPIKSRIKFIKNKHHADDVKEIDRQLRILVKDTARKLQTAMEHESAKRRPGYHEVIGSTSK